MEKSEYGLRRSQRPRVRRHGGQPGERPPAAPGRQEAQERGQEPAKPPGGGTPPEQAFKDHARPTSTECTHTRWQTKNKQKRQTNKQTHIHMPCMHTCPHTHTHTLMESGRLTVHAYLHLPGRLPACKHTLHSLVHTHARTCRHTHTHTHTQRQRDDMHTFFNRSILLCTGTWGPQICHVEDEMHTDTVGIGNS